jgi:hypothetical protein
MDAIVVGKSGVCMFEQLDFDMVDAELEGSHCLSRDAFGTDAELTGEDCGLETSGGEKVEIDGKTVTESEGEGSASSQGKA